MNTEDIKGTLKYRINYPLAFVISHPYLYIDDKEKLKSFGIDEERYEKLNTYNDELTEEEADIIRDELVKEVKKNEELNKEEIDIFKDLANPGLFELKAEKFFCSINDPTKAEYWSSEKIEYDKAVNKEINNYMTLDSTTFEDVIEFAIKRALKYLSCNPKNSYWNTEKYSLNGTSGNSKYTQYGCWLGVFGMIAVQKLYQKYGIPSGGWYERDLGFGHSAKRYIDKEQLHIDTKENKFILDYKPKVKGDVGFHDELVDNLEKVKQEIKKYYINSKWFNTPISELLKEI